MHQSDDKRGSQLQQGSSQGAEPAAQQPDGNSGPYAADGGYGQASSELAAASSHDYYYAPAAAIPFKDTGSSKAGQGSTQPIPSLRWHSTSMSFIIDRGSL